MLKNSIAVAVLAFAVGMPAMAAPSLPKLGGLAANGRGMPAAFSLPSASKFKLPQASGSSAGQMPSLPGLPDLSGSGKTPAIVTTLKTGPATLLAVTPLSKSTEVLPSSGLGIRSTKITTLSLKGKLSGSKAKSVDFRKIGSEFTATLTSLPVTGLGVVRSFTSSLKTLPGQGVAQLQGLGL